eukprot:7068503-Pyramimonas_sp.AAC.2
MSDYAVLCHRDVCGNYFNMVRLCHCVGTVSLYCGYVAARELLQRNETVRLTMRLCGCAVVQSTDQETCCGPLRKAM